MTGPFNRQLRSSWLPALVVRFLESMSESGRHLPDADVCRIFDGELALSANSGISRAGIGFREADVQLKQPGRFSTRCSSGRKVVMLSWLIEQFV